MSEILKRFLPLGITITLLCGLVYVLLQQNYRIAANDPQLQFSTDIAESLNQGNPPEVVIPATNVDMQKSLAVFIMVFNKEGKVVLSTGQLAGKIPEIPKGVFDFTAKNGQDKITWQPQKGVRAAIVVVPYKEGYVLVGRSLREIEKRINMLGFEVFLGWVITILAAFFAKVFLMEKAFKVSRRKLI